MLLIALLSGVSTQAFSQPKTSRSSRTAKYQKAIADLEGATVYQKANFDAPVLEYLRPGTKVISTVQRIKGIGGFGLFYKVKTPSGKIGYVPDVELVTEYKIPSSKKAPAKKNPVYEDAREQQEHPDREPVYFTRYIGGGAGMLGFSEKLSGKKFSSQTTMYMFKMTGPGTLIDGPPLDFSFSFSPKAPSYYDKISTTPTGGFFVFSDILLNMPLLELNKGVLFYGLGVMATYTKFSPSVRISQAAATSTSVDSQELRIGAAVSLGYAHRFGRYALRWDSKYYYEKTAYLGHWLSFQIEYK